MMSEKGTGPKSPAVDQTESESQDEECESPDDPSESLEDLVGFRIMKDAEFDAIAKTSAFSRKPFSSLRLRQFYEWANRNMSHPLSKKIEEEVWALMQALQLELNSNGLEGKFIKSGCYYEGVKVGYPDEFDYMFELRGVTREHLKVTHTYPSGTKPKPGHVRPRSYYKIHSIPVPKWSRTMKWLHTANQMSETQAETEGQRNDIDPRKMVTAFSKLLKGMLGDGEEAGRCDRSATAGAGRPGTEPGVPDATVDDSSTDSDGIYLDLNGPAVTVFLTLTSNLLDASELGHDARLELDSLMGSFERKPLQINVAIAIPVYRRHEERWPLEFAEEVGEAEERVQLADWVKGQIHKCHLVASGDFWKASFAEMEMRQMTSASRQSKNVFMALKTMRDFTSVTKPHEPDVLSTCALKVAFFKELVRFPHENDWAWERSPDRVGNILNTVEQDGLAGSMTGNFIKGDSALMESDRGYLEVRRITKDMHIQMDTDYFQSLGVSFYNVVFISSFVLLPLCISQFCNTADLVPPGVANNFTVTGYDSATHSAVFKTAFHGLLALLFSVGIAIIKRPESERVGRLQKWIHVRHFFVVIAMALGPVIIYNSATILSPRYSYVSVFLILAVYNGIFVSLPHKKYWYRSDDVFWLKWIGGQPHGIREVTPWNELYTFYLKHFKRKSRDSPWVSFKRWLTVERQGGQRSYRYARLQHWLIVNNKHLLTVTFVFTAGFFFALNPYCALNTSGL